jgi:hypothetical protein
MGDSIQYRNTSSVGYPGKIGNVYESQEVDYGPYLSGGPLGKREYSLDTAAQTGVVIAVGSDRFGGSVL